MHAVRLQQATLRAFHGEGYRCAGRNGVEPELVAEPGRPQNDVPVADAAQWSQREQALVLQPHVAVGRSIDVFATDGASGTRITGDPPRFVERFAGQTVGLGELPLLEV